MSPLRRILCASIHDIERVLNDEGSLACRLQLLATLRELMPLLGDGQAMPPPLVNGLRRLAAREVA